MSQKSHKISCLRRQLFKVKGQEKQFFAIISVSIAPMMLTSIIVIVEHKIWDKFYLKHFFMRSIVFEIEGSERAALIHTYCNAINREYLWILPWILNNLYYLSINTLYLITFYIFSIHSFNDTYLLCGIKNSLNEILIVCIS